MSNALIEWDCDVDGYVKLNSFWGGKEDRRCVQLTTPSKGWVQMTYNDARAFFQECIQAINDIEEEYDDNPPWWEVINNSSISSKTEDK